MSLSNSELRIEAAPTRKRPQSVLSMLAGDPVALVSVIFLVVLVVAAIVGPFLLPENAVSMNLRLRNTPPFSLDSGLLYFFGGDSLGRPILPRLLVASQTTLLIAGSTVVIAVTLGSAIGLIAGYYGGLVGNFVMRTADVIMSFPSLLLAMVVLYMLEPNAANVVIVLAITRLPLKIRVARAEALAIRERLFVEGARAVGADDFRILMLHIAPVLAPTMLTVATLDFAGVMLAESALSFLGIGIRPPSVTWGVMVASGKDFLGTAWWLAFWPGMAILLTALATNLLSNWLRIAMDPKLRWRLEKQPVGEAPERARDASDVLPVGDTDAAAADEPKKHLLEVRDLSVEFRGGGRRAQVVDHISFHLDEGETLVILGESGSGKSVTFDAILGLLESPPGYVTSGQALYRGQDLFQLPPSERRSLCGRRIALVSQDPLSVLNPVYTVGWQIAESFRIHQGLGRGAARARAIAMLERVGIPEPARRANAYPHEFSGGMRQRVIIAMALALNPDVIIADEPTTALDVTVEAQVLALLKSLQREFGVGLILITHSMGVAAEMADRVAVMYAGRMMETAPVRDIFRHPAHPYMRGLLGSSVRKGNMSRRLDPIPGQPPDLANIPSGCAFHLRCPAVRDICRTSRPPLRLFDGGRRASACHFYEEVMAGQTQDAGTKMEGVL